MSSNYTDFFRIIKDLNDQGIINSRNYLDDVLGSITKEFIPEDKIFFSSNCPQGRPIQVPYSVDEKFYIVLGANYPIAKADDVVVYEIDKSKVRHLIKGEYIIFTKEILLRMTPIKTIAIT